MVLSGKVTTVFKVLVLAVVLIQTVVILVAIWGQTDVVGPFRLPPAAGPSSSRSSSILGAVAANGRGPGRTVVIYNRIPKTGSTSLMQIPYRLSRRRKDFSVVFVNHTVPPQPQRSGGVQGPRGRQHGNHLLSLEEQVWFAANISGWRPGQPAIFHGHFAYFDLGRLPRPPPVPGDGVEAGSSRPDFVYINLIREPIDRMVSYYYFLRYGDDYRTDRVRSRMGDTMTIDECVARNHPDCDPAVKMWLQVPYFCGHSPHCWNPPGNAWALERAKVNLVEAYLLVGVTELIEDFAEALSVLLPQFFLDQQGAISNRPLLSHVRKTKHRDRPSDDTVARLRSHPVWKAEDEFYRFAKVHFTDLKDMVLKDGGRRTRRGGQTFYYMKVAPSEENPRHNVIPAEQP